MVNTNNPIELLVSISADTAGSKASLQEQLRKLSAELKGLELGVTIDDNAFRKTSNALEETNSQFVKLVRTSDSFTASFNKLGSESDVMAKRVTSSFKEMSSESTKSIEEIKRQFKDQGKDFTVKTDIDIEDGQKILKGLQVDVKQTEDSIERITYKLKDMGAGGGTELVQDSIKNIDSAAFNLSKNLNDATSKLTLLHQEGKISTESFNELSKKANELGASSGFKDLGNDIKQATLDQKQLTEEMKQQEAIQSKIGETVNKRSESVAKEEEAQARAINKTLDDQYKKYESINAKLDEHVSKLRLTQEQADKMASGISPTMGIDKLNDQERAMNKQVETNKVLNRELKEQEKLQERIRKLVNSIVAEQGKNPKAFGNNPEVNEMLNTLNKIDPASKGAAASVKGVSDGFDQLKATSTEAGRSSMGVMESFKIAMEKFPVWMAASTVFYGTVRSAREFMEIIVDIDTKMTDLRKVMADGTDFSAVFDRATLSAEKFGQSISEVMDSYIEFAKQGFMEEELGYLADAAVIASNVGDITAQNASELMTASLIQWKMDAKDAMG